MGFVKISDFGLTTLHTIRFENSVHYYHSVVGTPIYASPEQLLDRKYDLKADIFPLGLIFMELLTTFENDDSRIKALKEIRENKTLPDGFEDSFKEEGELIIKMTKKEHLLRPIIDKIIEEVNWIYNDQRGMISMQEKINSFIDEMEGIKNREKESLEQMREEMRKLSEDYDNKLEGSLKDATKQLSDARNDLETTRNELITQLKEANNKLEGLQKNPVPIGFIYVQLPSQPEPKTLWSMVEWKDVTSDYAGLFFRAGGGSAPFGQKQTENAPRLTEVGCRRGFDLGGEETEKINPGNRSKRIYAGSWDEQAIQHGLIFKVSDGEVRPRNIAIHIWKRTN